MTDDFDQEPLSGEEQLLKNEETKINALVGLIAPLAASFADPEKVAKDEKLYIEGDEEVLGDYRRVLAGDEVDVYDFLDEHGYMEAVVKQSIVGGVGQAHKAHKVRLKLWEEPNRVDWSLIVPNLVDKKMTETIKEMGIDASNKNFSTEYRFGVNRRIDKTIDFPKEIPDDRPNIKAQGDDSGLDFRIVDSDLDISDLIEVVGPTMMTIKLHLEREKAYRDL